MGLYLSTNPRLLVRLSAVGRGAWHISAAFEAQAHLVADGRPIPIESRPDLSKLSDEELEQLKNFSEKAQPKRSG